MSLTVVNILLLNFVALVQGQFFKINYGRCSKYQYPNPRRNPSQCGVFRPGNICDPVRLLKPAHVKHLDREIKAIYSEVHCACCMKGGYKISIAFLRNTPDDDEVPNINDEKRKIHSRDVARVYAYHLLHKYKVGICGEDVVILYVLDTEMILVEAGTEARPLLRQSDLRDVEAETVPKLQIDAFEGLLFFIKEIRSMLSQA